MSEFTLRIDGMHCGACVRRVSQALATEGLTVKEIRLGAARIEPDSRSPEQDSSPVERAIAVIAKAGYRAYPDIAGEVAPAHSGN